MSPRRKSGRSYRDVAVFYRINAQSRALEDELVKNRIPYTVVGGMKFYERKEIKDVLAYLKLIDNPSDGLSLKRIINVPSRGIGEKTIEKIEAFSREKGLPLYEGLKTGDRGGLAAPGRQDEDERFIQLIEDVPKRCRVPLPSASSPWPFSPRRGTFND